MLNHHWGQHKAAGLCAKPLCHLLRCTHYDPSFSNNLLPLIFFPCIVWLCVFLPDAWKHSGPPFGFEPLTEWPSVPKCLKVPGTCIWYQVTKSRTRNNDYLLHIVKFLEKGWKWQDFLLELHL